RTHAPKHKQLVRRRTMPEVIDAPQNASVDEVREAMMDVVDPELGVNIVDLGLVYGISVEDDGTAVIEMTLTSAACPLTDVIEDQTAQSLEGIVPAYRINWVWMPPWGPEKITEDGRAQVRALGFNLCTGPPVPIGEVGRPDRPAPPRRSASSARRRRAVKRRESECARLGRSPPRTRARRQRRDRMESDFP